ncbi:hypothetical protein [Sphingosinicella sp. CPCC 101087]|uniref:hypothetical protein n=1 Tax=Sphingosinicella sp. CPCC 101087 TaxID=2497754 RepID=UPI00101C983A|nr:hypothetical protein [Sphingosinicella sp. CPCC 101087]
MDEDAIAAVMLEELRRQELDGGNPVESSEDGRWAQVDGSFDLAMLARAVRAAIASAGPVPRGDGAPSGTTRGG